KYAPNDIGGRDDGRRGQPSPRWPSPLPPRPAPASPRAPDGSPKEESAMGPLVRRVTNFGNGRSTDVDASDKAIFDFGQDGSNLPRGLYQIDGVSTDAPSTRDTSCPVATPAHRRVSRRSTGTRRSRGRATSEASGRPRARGQPQPTAASP